MRRSVVCLALLATCAAAFEGQAPLVLVRRIALPQVEGRIDHLAVDVENARLFVAALGNDTVEVIDLRAGVRARSLAGFHEPQGIALPPDGRVVAVANGQSGDLRLLDRGSFELAKTVPLGDDPDNVRYDARAGRLYVGYGSGAIAAVDARSGARHGDVKLAGHPESFQLERDGSRIFVNVPTARHVAVIDRDASKLLTTWPIAGAESNFPMALDEADRRLFVGCRRPARLLVLDTSSGTIVSGVDVVGDTDDLFYDAARKRVYVTGGEGFVDVFQQRDPDHLARTERVATAAGARTSLFVAQQNRLYVAVPHRGAQRAEIREYEVR